MNIDFWNEYKTTGSRTVLNTLVANEMPLVRKCVRRFTKGRARDNDFEDMVQNGCIGLLRAIDLWTPSRGRWETFAFMRIRLALQRITPTQVLMQGPGRGFQRCLTGPDVLFDDETDTLFRSIASRSVSEQEMLMDEMLKAVQKLPSEERRVIEQRFLDDLPLREVAQAMGVATGTAFNIEKRAIKRLRKMAA